MPNTSMSDGMENPHRYRTRTTVQGPGERTQNVQASDRQPHRHGVYRQTQGGHHGQRSPSSCTTQARQTSKQPYRRPRPPRGCGGSPPGWACPSTRRKGFKTTYPSFGPGSGNATYSDATETDVRRDHNEKRQKHQASNAIP